MLSCNLETLKEVAFLTCDYHNQCHITTTVNAAVNNLVTVLIRFLLGTGRMPHPVGGAMGVTLRHCREKGNTRFDIISLNIHKTT